MMKSSRTFPTMLYRRPIPTMTKEKIDRINELARKMRTIGLTLEEKAEQQDLRDEYRRSVVNNLRSQLDNIEIVDKDKTE